jgi:hypothetical protein
MAKWGSLWFRKMASQKQMVSKMARQKQMVSKMSGNPSVPLSEKEVVVFENWLIPVGHCHNRKSRECTSYNKYPTMLSFGSISILECTMHKGRDTVQM